MDDDRLMHVFFDVQRGLPRQGPGDRAATLRALELCDGLPATADVLDVGCGPGLQTVALALATGGSVTAVDLHEEYLDQLTMRAQDAGVADRLEIVVADMAELPFAPGSFDLVWSEGAAYIMGFGDAFAAWRPLLRPGGFIGATELTWLVADPPAECAEFFADGYPAMTDIETNLATIRAADYEVVGHFTLPDSAWWDDYYTPLQAKLPELRTKYAGDAEAIEVVESTATEIDVRRRFGDSYAYEFFIARRPAT